MKILVADKLDPRHMQALMGRGLVLADRAGITPDALLREVVDADGLIVRSRTQVNAAVIDAAPRLKVIGRAGTGVDNIDVAAATRRGVVVMNTPGGNANAAAELALALLLSTARHVPAAHATLMGGRFEPARFVGVELRGKTLGIVGLGRIGRLLAEKCHGLGLRILGYDPVVAAARAREFHVESVELPVLFASADFVSLHLPLTDETRHLVDRDLIASMKPAARIVNVARGGIIDEAALFDALRAGRLGGAALDVFETEPPAAAAFADIPGLVVTPHLGAATLEAQDAVSRAALEQVADFLLGRGIAGAVNTTTLDPATAELIRPFEHLAERLGQTAAGALSGCTRLSVRVFGPVLSGHLRRMTSCFLKGYLGRFITVGVNEFNAFEIARERGWIIEETEATEHHSFLSLLRFECEGQTTLSLEGTLFGRQEPRLVAWNNHQLDAIPEGWMLVVTNQDRPGMVGQIGTALGTAGVNIAGMSLGRSSRRGEALSILSLDSKPPAAALAMLRQQDGITSVRLISVDAKSATKSGSET